MAKTVEEQIKELETLLANIESAREKVEDLASKSVDDIKNAATNISTQYKEALKDIEKAYGKQADYLSSQELAAELQLKLIEKERQERQKLIEVEERRLEYIKKILATREDQTIAGMEEKRVLGEIQELQKKLKEEKAKETKNQTEINNLTKKHNDLAREAKSHAKTRGEAEAFIKREKHKVVKGSAEELALNATNQAQINSLISTQEERIKSQKDLNKVVDDTKDSISETLKEQKNQNAIIDNTIAKFTGLKMATGGFLDLLIEASEEEDGLAKLADKVSKRFEMMTNPVVLLGTALSFIGSKLNDLSNKINQMNFSIAGMATSVIEIPITFVRDTGFSEEVAESLQELSKESGNAGFLISEMDVAFRGLSTTMTSFTRMGNESRKYLTEQAALLERAGLAAGVFGKSVDELMKTMNMSDKASAELTEEIASFGKVVGMGADKAVQDFTANLDLLATFGDQKGVEIFKKLAIAANEAGVEINTLNQIANKFETFDSAMKSAGKLNFILRGPFLNSMELLQATPERTLEILRKGFDDAGKSFDDFGRRGREAIASTLGVSVDVAKKLFDDRSIKSAKEIEQSLMNRARGEKDLTDEMRNNLTLQQKQELVYEKILQILMPLSEAFYGFMTAMTEFADSISGVLAFVGALTSGLKALLLPLGVMFGRSMLGKMKTFFTGSGGLEKGIEKSANAAASSVGKFTKLAGSLTAVAGGFYGAMAARNAYQKAETTGEKVGAATAGGLSGVSVAAGILGTLALIPGVNIGAAAIAGSLALGGALGVGTTMLNEGTDNFRGVGTNGAPMSMMRRQSDIGMAIVGDAPGGRMTPYTEAVSLKQGDAVLNSGDVASMTSAIRALPNVLEMFTQAAQKTNETALRIANTNTNTGEQKQTLNLVIKMDEREIARVSREVSMETMERGFQIPLG